MTNVGTLTQCLTCKTKWYERIFAVTDCPSCHGNPEKTDSAFIKINNIADFLCLICYTAWQQNSNEKPECPSCKNNKKLTEGGGKDADNITAT